MYIDTHTHLDITLSSAQYEERYKKNNPFSLSALLPEKLEHVIHISLNPDDFLKNYPSFHKNEKIHFATGIYPDYSNLPEKKQSFYLSELKYILTSYKHIALGEIGIDLKHAHYGDVDAQKKLFRKQIEIAEELKLPIIVHSRNSFQECWSIIKEYNVKVIMHCFSYGVTEAEKILDRGDIISFAGNLTYKNNTALHNVAKMIPLNQILLETDCPYLTPEPLRKEWNIPENIRYIYDFFSALQNIEVIKLSEHIKQNFSCIFGINI